MKSGTEYLTIYGTGMGSVQGQNGKLGPADGQTASFPPLYWMTARVSATLGSVNVPVTFPGLTPGEVALYQVNVQVPPGVPTGDAVPLVLTVTSLDGTTAQSNTVTVAVQ